MTEVKEVIELLETAETKCLCTDDRLQPLAEIRKALALLREPCGTCGGTRKIERPVWDVTAPNDGKDYECPDCQEPAKPVDCKYSPHCKDFGNPFCNESCIGKEPAEDEQADDPPQEVKDRWRAEEQEKCPEEAKVELPSEIVKGWTGLKPAEKPKRRKGKHKLIYHKEKHTIVAYCKKHDIYYPPSGQCYKCCPEPAEKPPASEFTEEIRDYIADFIYAEKHGVAMQHKPRCLERDLIEACDRLDAAEAQAEFLIKAKKNVVSDNEKLRKEYREMKAKLKQQAEQILEYRKMANDENNFVVCGVCRKKYHTLKLFDCPFCEQALKD